MPNKTDNNAQNERVVFMDNLKGILIFLVVLGHVLLPIRSENAACSYVFDIIYQFHMPLFIFVSGFFAKSIVQGGRLRAEKILSTFLLALLFQVAVLAADGNPQKILSSSLLSFSSAPWYLVSLASWYLLIPLLKSLRPWAGMMLSVCISLVAGGMDGLGPALALMRTLVFLPFFATGFYCTKETLAKLRRSKAALTCTALVVAFAVAYALTDGACAPARYLVYGSTPYKGSNLAGMLGRCWWILIACVISAGIIRIVPGKHTFLSRWGENTLPVYVFHRIARGLMVTFSIYKLPAFFDPVWALPLCVAISLAMTALFSLKVFGAPLNAIMRLKWSKATVHNLKS